MTAALLGQVAHAIRRDGLRATLGRIARRIHWELSELRPSRRRAMAEKARKDRAFDRARGVDTGGVVSLATLSIAGRRRDQGAAYWGVDPDELAEILAGLPLRHEDFVFVDLGSGKGRALLLAADLPFKRIVGVEFAEELHRVAERNVHGAGLTDRIELICTDAADYPLPHDPLVLYLFHPFDDEVMAEVIANLRRSLVAVPREIAVVYVNPLLDALFLQADFLRVAYRDPRCAVYLTREHLSDG